MKGRFLIILLSCFVAIPCIASAGSNPVKSNVWDPTILAGPFLTCTGTGNNAYTLANGDTVPAFPACHDLCDLVAEFTNIIYIVIAYVIWIIAPITFCVGGIMYMLAGANPSLESTAKSTLKGAVIGVVVVLCSYIIVYSVVHAFNGLSQYVGGFGASVCSV